MTQRVAGGHTANSGKNPCNGPALGPAWDRCEYEIKQNIHAPASMLVKLGLVHFDLHEHYWQGNDICEHKRIKPIHTELGMYWPLSACQIQTYHDTEFPVFVTVFVIVYRIVSNMTEKIVLL
jgi:hypothetical protein